MPIGTLSRVSQTRSSKSVPIRTTRNGASGARGRDRRRDSRMGRWRMVLDQTGARPAPRHVGKRSLAIPLVDEAQASHAARRRDDDRLAEGRGSESRRRASNRPAGSRPASALHGRRTGRAAGSGRRGRRRRRHRARRRIAQELPRPSIVIACRNAFGVRPAHRLKTCWKCEARGRRARRSLRLTAARGSGWR